MSEWALHETSRHQDHVIAHVLGATALGYFEFDQAAHFFLDIGFIWTIFPDGEMALVPRSMALKELGVDEGARADLLADTIALENDPHAAGLSRITRAPAGCLIESVDFYARGDQRRVLIVCEGTDISVETSLQSGEVRVSAGA